MTLLAGHLNRILALNLPSEALREVLSVVADVQATDEQRRAAMVTRQREYREGKEAALRDTNCDSHKDSHGQKENPPDPLKKKLNINIPTARARATRVSPDFEPIPNIWELAKNRGFTIAEAREELTKFIDHFTAKSGQDASKNDWNAAFRNWIKRAADLRKRYQGRASPGQQMRDAIADVGDLIRTRHDQGPAGLS